MRKTARQSCLLNVAVYAAAVHCEVVRMEVGPNARRAKIACGNELPDESVQWLVRCKLSQNYCTVTVGN